MFQRWLLRRDVLRLPRLTATTVEGRVVRVTGTVRALSDPLIAPCTGRPCVAFGVSLRTTGILDVLNLDAFVTVPPVIVESREFALELNGGELVTIDPVGSLIELGLARAKRLNTDRERLQKFRERHEIPSGASFGSHENVIEPGAIICVAGALVRDPQRPDGEIMFRNEPETRARIIGDRQRWIRIVDGIA
jgi:hypothetical protein